MNLFKKTWNWIRKNRITIAIAFVSISITICIFIYQDYQRERAEIVTEQRHEELLTMIKSTQPQDASESLKEKVRTAEERLANPITAEDFFLKAYAAHIDKNFETAIKYYDKVIELLPNECATYYNWGTALGQFAETKKGKESEDLYKQASEKFQKAAQIKPDYYEAFYNWGACLRKLAETKTGKEAEILFKQACDKFQKAVQIKPNEYDAFYNWGTALLFLAEIKRGKEAEKIVIQALEKFQKAAQIQPDKCEVFGNWGYSLLRIAKTKTGKNKENLLNQALEKLEKAVELGGRCYNLARCYAIMKNKEKALFYLEKSIERKEFPIDVVLNDEDWKFYFDDEDFKKIIEKYKS